jgi:hypothetical protein
MLNTRKQTVILSCILFAIAALTTASAATGGVSLPAVFRSVRHEFGGARGGYFVPNRLVSEQVIMGMGIPSPTRHLADGNYLVSGCRRHSCDEKAAVIVTPVGVILAAGLINFHCYRNAPKHNPAPVRAAGCDHDPRLTVIVRQKNNQPVLTQELQSWAAREGHVRTTETEILR